MKRILALCLCGAMALGLTGCSGFTSSKSITYTVENGDKITVTLDTSNGYKLKLIDESPFVVGVTKDGETVCKGEFSYQENYSTYVGLVLSEYDEAYVSEDGLMNGNQYYIWNGSGSDNYADETDAYVVLTGSYTAFILVTETTEEELKDVLKLMTFTVASSDAPSGYTDDSIEETMDAYYEAVDGTEAAVSDDADVDDESDDEQAADEPDDADVVESEEDVAVDTEDEEVETEDEAAPVSMGEGEFDGMTIVDNDECSITITDYSEISGGFTVTAEMENKTADSTLMFSLDTSTVNGAVCDPFFATEVAAGEKSVNVIDFSYAAPAPGDYGITNYTDIGLGFRVYDSDDWSADDIYDDLVHLYPYGEENATAYEWRSQDDSGLITDNEYAMVVATGYEWDETWGYVIDLFIQNNTDSELMLSAEDASVNDYMIDPLYAESVPAGCCTISKMYFDYDDLNDAGITEIESIAFTLRGNNNDDWSMSDYFDIDVTLTPEG